MTETKDLNYSKMRPCKKHPETNTAWECKNCATPICPGCAIPLTPMSSTRFCSEDCKKQFSEYQEWMTENRPKDTFMKSVSPMQWIKTAIKATVMLAIIWTILFFATGATTPLAQLGYFWGMITTAL